MSSSCAKRRHLVKTAGNELFNNTTTNVDNNILQDTGERENEEREILQDTGERGNEEREILQDTGERGNEEREILQDTEEMRRESLGRIPIQLFLI